MPSCSLQNGIYLGRHLAIDFVRLQWGKGDNSYGGKPTPKATWGIKEGWGNLYYHAVVLVGAGKQAGRRPLKAMKTWLHVGEGCVCVLAVVVAV